MSDPMKALLEALSTDVAEVLVSAVTEAHECRQRIEVPEYEADLEGIHEALVGNRRMIGRLEELTSTLVLIRSRAAKAQARARGATEDAYAKAATAKSVGFGDFASAKEKDAHAHAAALTQIIEQRKADAFYRDVDSAYEFCRVLLRGAEGAQRDLEHRLRILSLRSAMS